jgi:hypothetical protein
MRVNKGGCDHQKRIIAAKRYDSFGNVLRGDQIARADYHVTAPESRKPNYTFPSPRCCSFSATWQKEMAQATRHGAVRRGLGLGREALGLLACAAWLSETMRFCDGGALEAPYESNCPPCHRIDHCVCHGRVSRTATQHNSAYYRSDPGRRHCRLARCKPGSPTFDPLAQALGGSSTALLEVELQRLMRTW